METDAPGPDPLTILPGVSDQIAGALCQAGLVSLADVARAGDETLLAIPGIGPTVLKKIRQFLVDRGGK